MPVEKHHASEGWYYSWGEQGKKFFFDPGDPRTEELAKRNAERQGRAAYAHGHRGK